MVASSATASGRRLLAAYPVSYLLLSRNFFLQSRVNLRYSNILLHRFDSARPDFSPYGFTCELWTPTRMPRPDRHNEVEFNLLRSGSLTYLLGGHRTTIAAGKLVVFWAAIPHQIVDFEGEEPYFVVTIPLSGFLAAGLELGVVNRVLKGELLIDSAHDASDELKFQQWENELRQSDPGSERAVWLEVQARLLRFVRAVSNRRTARYPEPALSRADQLACYIAQNYHQPMFVLPADSEVDLYTRPNQEAINVTPEGDGD